jgi:hypothetical protein
MRRFLLGVLIVAACGDGNKPQLHEDAGPADAGGAGRVLGCLDRPGVAPAPAGQLPCDLVPPGVQL